MFVSYAFFISIYFYMRKIAEKPLLSIIIVKYRCDQYLNNCLGSIGKNPLWETIVSDNDRKNIGYGAGCNKGAVKAKGKYLFFLNPDTLILGKSLYSMVNFFEKNAEVATIGPKVYKNKKKERQLSFCRFPDPLTCVFVYSPLKNLFKSNLFWNRFVYKKDLDSNKPLEVDAISGAALMIRKSVFDRIGGFDEKFFFYFEDNDLCRRVQKNDGKICYFPKAEVVHFGGKSTENQKTADKYFKESRKYFFKKNYGLFFGFLTEILIESLEWVSSLKHPTESTS